MDSMASFSTRNRFKNSMELLESEKNPALLETLQKNVESNCLSEGNLA